MAGVMTIAILFFVHSFTFASARNEVFPRAYVTVKVTGPNSQFDHKLNKISPVFTEGIFLKPGVVKNTEGKLCYVGKNDWLKPNISPKDSSWIGVIYDDETDDREHEDIEHDNRGNKIKLNAKLDENIEIKKKSLNDRIKEILLLGASAIIIMVKNVHIAREFDVTQVFSKPVIFLHGVENATKILQLFSLKYNLYAKIQRSIPYYGLASTIGTVTLWATCGRSTGGTFNEWQGTVCIGQRMIPGKAMEEYYNIMTWNATLLLFICLIAYIYIKLSRNGIDLNHPVDELNNEILAKHILSHMRIEIYRSKGRTSGKKCKKGTDSENERSKKFDNQPEQCVICLDMFFPMQRLRVLPCKHSFHLNCIDRWLLIRQTCPMCKYNILDNVPARSDA